MNKNRLLRGKKGTKEGSDPFVPFYVELAEIFAARWQLVVLERGQDLLQLKEQTFAWGILVGVHVKR